MNISNACMMKLFCKSYLLLFFLVQFTVTRCLVFLNQFTVTRCLVLFEPIYCYPLTCTYFWRIHSLCSVVTIAHSLLHDTLYFYCIWFLLTNILVTIKLWLLPSHFNLLSCASMTIHLYFTCYLMLPYQCTSTVPATLCKIHFCCICLSATYCFLNSTVHF